MRRLKYLFLGLVAVLSLAGTAATAQPFASDSVSLSGSLHVNATVSLLGETVIDAVCSGYPAAPLIAAPMARSMEVFPLLGETTLRDLDSAILVKGVNLAKVKTIGDLYKMANGNITTYSDVDISLASGAHILGFERGQVSLEAYLPYAVSHVTYFSLTDHSRDRFLTLMSDGAFPYHYQGDSPILTAFTNDSVASITNDRGQVVWKGSLNSTFVLVSDKDFSVIQEPPLGVFPLSSDNASVNFSVLSAHPPSVNLPGLLSRVREENYSEILPDFAAMLDSMIGVANDVSFIANGALVVQSPVENWTVAGTNQTFDQLGFAHISRMQASIPNTDEGLTFSGAGNLVFLGDHFYNAQAAESDQGLVVPYIVLALWLVTAAFLVYVRFARVDVPRPDPSRRLWYATWIAFGVAAVISFILVDREVSRQLGTSAIDMLATGSNLFTVLVGVQALLWVVGYLAFALPVQLLGRYGIGYLVKDKPVAGFAKVVSVFFVWIFVMLYFQLFLNALWPLVAPGGLS